MNMHLPQTEGAHAEAATLMAVSQNLITSRMTGKQVMSLLIHPNRKCRVLVNFDLKERNYASQQSMT
jgi:hypothetical protein